MAPFFEAIVNCIAKIPFLKRWFMKQARKETDNDVDPNIYTLH
jgi:hypothetical protein